MLPLEGVRVVDLSAVVLGPYASQNLADYGADVIKVEPPGGDSTRHTGPGTEPGMGAIFLGVNRGKRSVVLDLKQAADRATLERLLATADVLIHSMRPQKLAALDLEPQPVRARHPRLVYVGLHGFAEAGPYGGRPAYDDIIQGLSGCAALMQMQGGEPRYLPTVAADKTCGLVATQAILMALLARERSGQGCVVEVPMFESMVAFNLVEHLYGHHFEPPLADWGYPRALATHRRPYRTADGHLCVMPYNDTHWRRFFAEVGQPHTADDPRFATLAARTRHIGPLYALLADLLAQRSTAQWLAVCERLEIPCAPMNRLQDLPDDPHLRATGFFQSLSDPAMGTLRFPAPPVRFNGAVMAVRLPPRLGEHTESVLRELELPQDAPP